MNKTDEILDVLRSINWTAAPQAATRENTEGATEHLKMYARFIMENQQDVNQSPTPFASPLQVLGVQDVHVPQSVADECLRLAGLSEYPYDQVYFMRALEWAALCDSKHPSTIGRENMFDPLIGLVINRVPATIRKGYWVVAESMYPLSDWLNRYAK